ncbi:hypothetical protein [Streptomyces sp.]|uniref:hypothetical protein n=1 Tax=Streptomyces sp. TaxID=1931 RepID=UPI002F40499C
MADAQPTPPAPPPGRRVLARLNPDLTDSPLRRALYDANLRAPFGIDTPPTDDQPDPPTIPET